MVFRRLSGAFRNKDKEKDRSKRQSLANGGAQTNGVQTQVPIKEEKAQPEPKSSTEAASRYPEPPDHGHGRADIAKAMESLGNLVSHSMRPLPENGDGTYNQEAPHSSMFKELRTIGLKDVKTLRDKLAAGTDPIDDKTMLVGIGYCEMAFFNTDHMSCRWNV